MLILHRIEKAAVQPSVLLRLLSVVQRVTAMIRTPTFTCTYTDCLPINLSEFSNSQVCSTHLSLQYEFIVNWSPHNCVQLQTFHMSIDNNHMTQNVLNISARQSRIIYRYGDSVSTVVDVTKIYVRWLGSPCSPQSFMKPQKSH